MVWLRVRRWVVRPIVWAFALVAVALLAFRAYLDSDHARERLARALERELGRVVGRAVSVGDFDFELLPMRIVVRDLLVPSDRPSDPPFLEAREIAVDIDADALRRDLVDLETVSVHGLRVRVALRPGGDNLPTFPPAAGGGRFAVRIGGLYVEDGELDLADRRLPLDLSARAVLLRLVGIGGTDLQGSVTAQEVETRLPGAQPWPATVSARVRIERDAVEILTARLSSAWLDARVAGRVGWRGGTHGELAGRVDTSGAWLDERGWLPGAIDGPLRFDGTLRFARRDLALAGRLESSRLRLFGFAIDELEGDLSGDGQTFELALGGATYHAGPIGGRFVAELGGAEERGRLELALEAIPVGAVLADLELPPFRLAATAHGELALDFPLRSVRQGRGAGSFELRAAPQAAGEVAGDGVLGIELGEGALRIAELALTTAGQRIAASGEIELATGEGRIDVELVSADLGELARLQPFVALVPPPLWLPTAGGGEVEAHVRLAPGAAEADLAFDLVAVEAPGIVAPIVIGGLTVLPERVADLDLRVERDGARLNVAGALPIGAGSDAGELELGIAFEGWPAEEARAWAPLPVAISGPANGELRLRGTWTQLGGDLVGYVSPVELAGVAAERLDLTLAWDEQALHLARAELRAEAGAVRVTGTVGLADPALELQLASLGDGLELSRSPFAELWGDRLAGRLRLAGVLTGPLSAPEGRLDGTVEQLRFVGRRLDSPEPARLSLALAGGRVEVELVLADLLAARGGGELVLGESADLAVELSTDRLGPLVELATGAGLTGLTGALRTRLELRQAAAAPPRIELVTDRLDLAHEGLSLALLEPSRLRLEGGQLTIDSLFLGDASGHDELFVGGKIGLDGEGRLDLNVQAAVSADWTEAWTGLEIDGRIELLSKLGGSVASPEWNGEAALRHASFVPPRLPHTVENLEALALFYPDAIVLDSARCDFAGGTAAAFGRIDLPRTRDRGQPVDYRFQVALADAAVRYPEGFLLRGGGELTLQSTTEGRQIRGEVDLARIDYVQDLELAPMQIVQRFLTRTRLQVDETDDTLASTYLNVAISGPDALRVRNNLARIDGDVDLVLRGTLANPVLFGEVVTAAGGAIEYGGNEYELERGVLTFVNPSRIVPIVDFVAQTRIDDYEVRIAVGGSLDRLTTGFSANPPLPEYDVLALLATGSATGEQTFSGGGPSGAGALAAESLLYGQAAALIGQRVGTLFGVDRLRIEPLTTGDTVSAARVTVGKRLSRRVYVTYSVDPSSTAQQILEVEWRLSDELTLVLTQNGDGSYALDTRWGRRF